MKPWLHCTTIKSWHITLGNTPKTLESKGQHVKPCCMCNTCSYTAWLLPIMAFSCCTSPHLYAQQAHTMHSKGITQLHIADAHSQRTYTNFQKLDYTQSKGLLRQTRGGGYLSGSFWGWRGHHLIGSIRRWAQVIMPGNGNML